jgi:hypothetical protein
VGKQPDDSAPQVAGARQDRLHGDRPTVLRDHVDLAREARVAHDGRLAHAVLKGEPLPGP